MAVYLARYSSSSEIVIPRKGQTELKFTTYEPLEQAFAAKQIHPLDLKQAVTDSINKVRDL